MKDHHTFKTDFAADDIFKICPCFKKFESKSLSQSFVKKLSHVFCSLKYDWAVTWDFQQFGMCDWQSLRSACAYAQYDQSLCKSLEYSMSVKLLTEHHLEFLTLKRGCRGSSESTLVKMPHCWKSHVMAQIYCNMSRLLWSCLIGVNKVSSSINIVHTFLLISYTWAGVSLLTLNAPITTAADDKFCDIFPSLWQK